MSITFLTVATCPAKAHWLLQSAYAYRVSVNVLGVGDLFPVDEDGLIFNSHKILHMRRALVDLEGIVAFVDGFDCLFVRDPAPMEKEFLQTGRKVLMASEVCCAPDHNLVDAFPLVDTPYRFLNSGCYIGRAADLRELLAQIDYTQSRSDQLLLCRYYVQQTGRLSLDHVCQFFQCLHYAEEHLVETPHGLQNRFTGSLPYVIHGNGNTDMSAVRRWLARRQGWSVPENIIISA